jgi:peptide/nickel transport system permease protein
MLGIITNLRQIGRMVGQKFGTDDTDARGTQNIFLERLSQVLSQDRKAQFGLLVVSAFIGTAIFAPLLAPHDPMAGDFRVLQPPSAAHPLGTDTFGRSVLSRLLFGARLSLSIAILAVVFGAVVGCTLGLIAGFVGGRTDDAIMRLVDTIWAFPYLLIAIMLVAIIGPGFWNVVIAIAIADIDDFARITRAEVLAVREEDFVLAAKMVGLADKDILLTEVLPNVITPIIVQFTILTARAMLSEATLSFLGLGVEPGTPTWGAMLGEVRDIITQVWWLSISAGGLITITVLGINMFGDALRDAFDVEEIGGNE